MLKFIFLTLWNVLVSFIVCLFTARVFLLYPTAPKNLEDFKNLVNYEASIRYKCIKKELAYNKKCLEKISNCLIK